MRACVRLSSTSRSSGSASVDEPDVCAASEEQEGRRALLKPSWKGVSAGGGVNLTDDPDVCTLYTPAGVACVELSGPALGSAGVRGAMRSNDATLVVVATGIVQPDARRRVAGKGWLESVFPPR